MPKTDEKEKKHDDFHDALIEIAKTKSHPTMQPGDYIDQDGLLVCGKCGRHKQVRVKIFENEKIINCACDCEIDEYNAEIEARKKQEQLMRLYSLQDACFSRKEMRNWTFEEAEGMDTPVMQAMKRYADAFPQMLKKNQGLLLWGNVGTGKTYAACCIANAVMRQGYGCVATNFPRLIQAISRTDRQQWALSAIDDADLLILDDLGVERDTSFMAEQVFRIIDDRYRCGKPLIITTNIPYNVIQSCQDDRIRIYDRIIDMCYPIHFAGLSKRRSGDRQLRMAQYLGV